MKGRATMKHALALLTAPLLAPLAALHAADNAPYPVAKFSIEHAVINQVYPKWSPGVQRYLNWLQGLEEDSPQLSSRYIGSLVADFHRNLLRGGVFCYPAEEGISNGKLRLLYEAGPLAFLVTQAGGYASDGRQSILDIVPESLHQRVPLFLGNRDLVKRVERFLKEATS